jgi:hypothetical protein
MRLEVDGKTVPQYPTLGTRGRVCVTIGMGAAITGFALTGYLVYLGLDGLASEQVAVPWNPWLPIGLLLFFGGIALNHVGVKSGGADEAGHGLRGEGHQGQTAARVGRTAD